MASIPLTHPEDPELAYFYGTIFIDDNELETGKATTNICVFADGQVDRSPTGRSVPCCYSIHMHTLLVLATQRSECARGPDAAQARNRPGHDADLSQQDRRSLHWSGG